MSLRISETSVFFMPVHTFAWIPFMLWGVNLILEHKRYLLGIFVNVFSTFCFFSAGYTYHLYYTIFLFPLYIFLFTHRNLKAILFSSDKKTTLYDFLVLGVSFIIPLLLSYPFLIKFIQTSLISGMRKGGNYNQSLYGSFTNVSEFISAYVYPPGSTPFGWVYFGLATLYVIVGGGLLSIFLENNARKIYLKRYTFLIVWILLVSTLGMANNIPWYRYLWEHLPFFANFRAWSRISIIVLPLWALLFGISIELISNNFRKVNKKIQLFILVALFLFSLSVLYFQQTTATHNLMKMFGLHHDIGEFSAHFLHSNQVLIGLFFILIVYQLLKFGKKTYFSLFQWKSVLVVLFFCFSAFDMQNFGLKFWTTPGHIYAKHSKPQPIEYKQKIQENFYKNRSIKGGNIYFDGLYSTGTIGGAGFSNYWKVEHSSRRNKDKLMREKVLGIASSKKIFLSAKNTYAITDAISFIEDSEEFESKSGSFEIQKFESERIRITGKTNKEGILSYIDNWDPDWYATVNGKEVELELLFTTFKSVKIPEGDFEVEFFYAPFRNVFDISTIRKKIKWYQNQTAK